MASQGRDYATLAFNQHKSHVSVKKVEQLNKGDKEAEELLKALKTSKDERVSSPNEKVTPEGGDFRNVIKGVSDHYEGKGRVGQRVLKKLGNVLEDNHVYLKDEVKVTPEVEEVSTNDESKISKTELDKILSKDLLTLTDKELKLLLEYRFLNGDDEWLIKYHAMLRINHNKLIKGMLMDKLEHFDILGRKNQNKLIEVMIKFGKEAKEILELLFNNFDKLKERKDLQNMIINEMLEFYNGRGDFYTIFRYFNKINGRPDLQKKCVDEAIRRYKIREMLEQVDGISGSGYEQYIAKNVINKYWGDIETAFITHLKYEGIPSPQAELIVNRFLFGRNDQLKELEYYIKHYHGNDINLTKIEKERRITSFLERKGNIDLDKNMAIGLLKSLKETGNPDKIQIGFGYHVIENKTLDYVIKNVDNYDVYSEEDFIRAFVTVNNGGKFLLDKIRKKEFSIDRGLLLKVLKEDPHNARLIAENVDLLPVDDEPGLIRDLTEMIEKTESGYVTIHPVLHNIEKFSVNHNTIVKILIEQKSFYNIGKYLHKLTGLTPRTIKLLRDALNESGYKDVVDNHPKIF